MHTHLMRWSARVLVIRQGRASVMLVSADHICMYVCIYVYIYIYIIHHTRTYIHNVQGAARRNDCTAKATGAQLFVSFVYACLHACVPSCSHNALILLAFTHGASGA
jgi:hypothetical protein